MKANLVLLGFMGTGKTTVARAVERLFQLRSVDTDEVVRARNGAGPCELIEERGEAAFRALEAEAVREVARQEGVVIATGGGVPLDPGNLEVLAESGVLLLLTATPATLARRLAGDSSRPLLSGHDPGALARQLEGRAPAYSRISLSLATDGREAEELARAAYALFLRHRGAESGV